MQILTPAVLHEEARELFLAHCSINITENIQQLCWWLYWCAPGRMLRTILSVKGWKTKTLSSERLHIPRTLANFLPWHRMKGHMDSVYCCVLSVKKWNKREKHHHIFWYQDIKFPELNGNFEHLWRDDQYCMLF